MTPPVLQDSQFQAMHHWSDMKKHLMPCLMGRDWNAVNWNDIPYLPFVGTMNMTFALRCGENKAVQLTNYMAARWNQSVDTLRETAVKNIETQGCVIKRLDTLLEYHALDDIPIYVISNPSMFLGAGVLCSEQLRIQAAQSFAHNMFILPASIHEVLAVPADTSVQARQLREMVQAVNHSDRDFQRLSDEIYLLKKEDADFLAVDLDKK